MTGAPGIFTLAFVRTLATLETYATICTTKDTADTNLFACAQKKIGAWERTQKNW